MALAAAAAFALTSCTWTRDEVEQLSTPVQHFRANKIRACLEKRPGEHRGLVFRTTSRSSDSFVGVIMMDTTTRPARTATVGIAIYDDADLLDAYEERARQDPTDQVTRVRNAVVSYHMPHSPRLELAGQWVQDCLRSP